MATRRFELASLARDLHEDEEGASMIFAVVTLFGLALSILFVFQVGMISSQKLQMQNAADAAAYAGAMVEANALNSLGQINDGMAYVNYTWNRYVVDRCVYSTLAQFKSHHQLFRPNPEIAQGFYGADAYPPVTPAGAPEPLGPDQPGPQIHNPQAPDFVLLGLENTPLLQQRITNINSTSRQALDARYRTGTSNQAVMITTKWLASLFVGFREIMNATPKLVGEAARVAAWENGAQFFAVSSDVDKAFAEGGRSGFDAVDGGERAAEPLYRRYGFRQIGSDKPRPLPSWYDGARGKVRVGGVDLRGNATGQYAQYRLCWNDFDWAHAHGIRGRTPGAGGQPPNRAVAPNGHWHARHSHLLGSQYDLNVKNPAPFFITHGGVAEGIGERSDFHWTTPAVPIPALQLPPTYPGCGHQLDHPAVHQAAQVTQEHARVTCPTCRENTDMNSPLTGVRKATPAWRFEGNPPSLYVLTSRLLTSGVTVATWHPGSGIEGLLDPSDWGILAVASAQVGYWHKDAGTLGLARASSAGAVYTDGALFSGSRVRIPLDMADQISPSPFQPKAPPDLNYRNFFYSADPMQGVRFSARLVPVARPETWHPDLRQGRGLAEILGPGSLGRWREVITGTRGSPPGLSKLGRFFTPRGPMGQQAIWH